MSKNKKTKKQPAAKKSKENLSGAWISFKLLFVAFIIMLGLSVILSSIYIRSFSSVTLNKTRSNLTQTSAQTAHKVSLFFERTLAETRVQARNLSIARNELSRSAVIDIMASWLRKRREYYKGVFVNFAPQMFDGRDSFFARDTRFSNGVFATHILQVPEIDAMRVEGDRSDWQNSDRFRIPFEEQIDFISNPQQVRISQERGDYYLLMRIASPIIYNGHSIGVIGVDYSMEDIVEMISSLQVLDNQNGVVSLALRDGFIIASGDSSLIYRNISEFITVLQRQDFERRFSGAEAASGNLGVFTATFPNSQRMLTGIYRLSISNTEQSFVIMTSLPEEYLLEATNTATKYAAIATIFFMLAGIAVLFILIQLWVITPLLAQMKTIEKMSITDALTGISNRRNFENIMNREWQSAKRNKKPLAFLILDADNFKSYNDTYGHPQGDRLLIALSGALKRALHRPNDLPARIGGEEFAVLLPDTDITGAAQVGEVIRSEIERLRIKNPDTGKITTCTVSIGVTSMIPTNYNSYEELMKIADDHLYRAKELGRNRVCSDLTTEDM